MDALLVALEYEAVTETFHGPYLVRGVLTNHNNVDTQQK